MKAMVSVLLDNTDEYEDYEFIGVSELDGTNVLEHTSEIIEKLKNFLGAGSWEVLVYITLEFLEYGNPIDGMEWSSAITEFKVVDFRAIEESDAE